MADEPGSAPSAGANPHVETVAAELKEAEAKVDLEAVDADLADALGGPERRRFEHPALKDLPPYEEVEEVEAQEPQEQEEAPDIPDDDKDLVAENHRLRQMLADKTETANALAKKFAELDKPAEPGEPVEAPSLDDFAVYLFGGDDTAKETWNSIKSESEDEGSGAFWPTMMKIIQRNNQMLVRGLSQNNNQLQQRLERLQEDQLLEKHGLNREMIEFAENEKPYLRNLDRSDKLQAIADLFGRSNGAGANAQPKPPSASQKRVRHVPIESDGAPATPSGSRAQVREKRFYEALEKGDLATAGALLDDKLYETPRGR